MKVLLDTNIIIDFALERQPWFTDSKQIIYFPTPKPVSESITIGAMLP